MTSRLPRLRPARFVPAAVLAAAAAVLAGCGSSPPTRFFTLDAAPASAPVAATAAIAPVRVDAVHIPPVLDRPELVRETAANEVTVSDFAHWSAPLGETARRTLTQDLAARLPAGAVTYPDAPKPADGRGLVVDILSVGHDGDHAVMDVGWTLTAGLTASGAPPVAYTARTLRVTAPAAAGPGAQAVELSALLSRLADAVAADLTAGRG